MSEFSKNFRIERMKLGLTQSDIARKLSVTRQTVNNWEKRGVTPDTGTLMALSELFGVSTDYLLGKESKIVTQKHLTNVNNRIKEDLGEDVEVMFRDITSFDDAEKEELKNFIDFIKSKKKKTP